MRCSPNKLEKLKRIKIKSRMKPEEATNKVVEEPDFYRMSPLPEGGMDHPLTKLLREVSSEDASSNSKVSSRSRATDFQSKPSPFPSDTTSTPSFGLYSVTSNQQARVPSTNLSYNDALEYLPTRMVHQEPIYRQPSFGHPFTSAPQCYSMNGLSGQQSVDQNRASSDYFQSSSMVSGQSASQEYTKVVTPPSTIPSWSRSVSEISDNELFEPLPYELSSNDSFTSADDFSDYIAETIQTL